MKVIKKTAKVIGKTVGTTALVVTGVSSTVLKSVSDTAGFELGSTVFGSAKKASFKGIKKMWSKKKVDEAVNKGESTIETETVRKIMEGYLNKAKAARKAAELYKQKGDESKYQSLMEEHERCMEKYRSAREEYRQKCSR